MNKFLQPLWGIYCLMVFVLLYWFPSVDSPKNSEFHSEPTNRSQRIEVQTMLLKKDSLKNLDFWGRQKKQPTRVSLDRSLFQRLKITGLIQGKGILFKMEQGSAQNLEIGEALEGWRLVKVHSEGAVFQKGGIREVVAW